MKKEEIATIFALFGLKLQLNESATIIHLQKQMLSLLDKKRQNKKYVKRIFETCEKYAQNVINTNISDIQIIFDIDSIICRYNKVILY